MDNSSVFSVFAERHKDSSTKGSFTAQTVLPAFFNIIFGFVCCAENDLGHQNQGSYQTTNFVYYHTPDEF